MNDKESYARCAACDSAFYPYYEPKIKAFEDLCSNCKQIAMSAAYDSYEEPELNMAEIGIDIYEEYDHE